MISQFTAQLKNQKNIQTIEYISPEKGFQSLKNSSNFGDILGTLKTNPLPAVLVVTPTKNNESPNQLEKMVSTLKNTSLVDIAQIDMDWVKRLYYLMAIGNRIIDTLGILFSIAVILIVGNTIRLTTQNHRQEITILKLIGATNGFIRRPLLYRGFMYGFFGGCLATLLVGCMLWALAGPSNDLAQTYGTTFTINGLHWNNEFIILAASAFLGLLGAWIAVRKHLIH